METFKLEIITPERLFFDGLCESVIVPSINGEAEFLAHAMPLVSGIVSGSLRIRVDGKWKEAAIAEGCVEVRPEKVIILSQKVLWPEEIARSREEEKLRIEQERLRQAKSIKEYKMGMANIARSLARLKVKNHSENNYE